MAGRLSRNQQAAHAWFSVNGDVERSHTCGVYLKRPSRGSGGQVLGVYVDSPSRVTDFSTNKELYLARLANAGYQVSDIDFRLSRTPKLRSQAPVGPATQARSAAPPLPPLDPGERREVSSLVSGLPEGLGKAAARAMSLSLRREKQRKNGI